MNDWEFADLDPEKLELVTEAEKALGADHILAFKKAPATSTPAAIKGLRPAPLDESRLDCLQGVEQQVDAVLVAYVAA